MSSSQMMGKGQTWDDHSRGRGQPGRGPDREMRVACSQLREKDTARGDAGSKLVVGQGTGRGEGVREPGFLGEAVLTYDCDGQDTRHEGGRN